MDHPLAQVPAVEEGQARDGSLPGTATEMVRAHNGFCWAILANTRTWQSGFMEDMDQLVWQVLKDTTIRWEKKELL